MQNCYVIPEDAPELIRGKTLKIVELDGGKYFTKITPFSIQLKQEEVDYVGSFLKRIVGEDIRELPYRTYGPLKVGGNSLTIVDRLDGDVIYVKGFTEEYECRWVGKGMLELKKINE